MANEKNNYLKNIFVQELITSFGYFAPISMLAVFLSEYKEMNASKVALAMFISSIVARWGRLLFSPLFDKISPSALLTLSQLIGSSGYFILTVSQSFTPILIGLILVGLFYGSNTIVTRVLISLLKSKNSTLNEKFSVIHIATNISSAIGPLIINLIYIYFNKSIAFLSMAIFLFCMGIFTFFDMRGIQIPKQAPWFGTLIKLLLDKKIWPIYLLILINWFFCAQMFSLAPLIIAHSLKMPDKIWTIAAINGTIIVLFSFKLNQLLSKFSKSQYLQITISLTSALIGFIILGSHFTIINLYTAILFLTFSEILFIPAFQALLAEVVPEESRIAIFAIYAVFMGIGEGSGYYFGAKKLAYSASTETALDSITMILLSILIFVGLFISVKKLLFQRKIMMS